MSTRHHTPRLELVAISNSSAPHPGNLFKHALQSVQGVRVVATKSTLSTDHGVSKHAQDTTLNYVAGHAGLTVPELAGGLGEDPRTTSMTVAALASGWKAYQVEGRVYTPEQYRGLMDRGGRHRAKSTRQARRAKPARPVDDYVTLDLGSYPATVGRIASRLYHEGPATMRELVDGSCVSLFEAYNALSFLEKQGATSSDQTLQSLELPKVSPNQAQRSGALESFVMIGRGSYWTSSAADGLAKDRLENKSVDIC